MARRICPDWDPPRPSDEEFARKVERLVWEADAWCRSTSGLPTKGPAWHHSGHTTRKPLVAVQRHFRRGCKGCGCHLDSYTAGCKQCGARHSMRRTKPKVAA